MLCLFNRPLSMYTEASIYPKMYEGGQLTRERYTAQLFGN